MMNRPRLSYNYSGLKRRGVPNNSRGGVPNNSRGVPNNSRGTEQFKGWCTKQFKRSAE